jgi:enoyl-CoA hydratase/carnithine racemase
MRATVGRFFLVGTQAAPAPGSVPGLRLVKSIQTAREFAVMTYATLATALTDRVLTITLNRPDRLNAFTVEMANELVAAFTAASEDDAVGAIVLTGAGRAFCAGMDLSPAEGGNVFGLDERMAPTMADMHARLDDPDIIAGVRDTGGRVTLAMFDCKKPIIAAINGAAVGIGATMTLAADFRLASGKARIGFVFGRLGVVPEACSSWFLPRLVGLQQALEWVYTAEIFGPVVGLTAGLLRSVHAPETLVPDAQALAARLIAGRSPVALAFARQMLWRNAVQPHPIEAHRVDSLAMFYASLADGKEGVRAFQEKREPVFTGKASAMPAFYEAWVGAHS